MIITLKNLHLDTVIRAIQYPMPFQLGRLRLKFLKVIGPKSMEINDARIELSISFADKDPKTGEPVIQLSAEGPEYKLSPENMALFKAEGQKLMVEECPIEIPVYLEKNMGDFLNMINNSKVEFDDQDTLILEDAVTLISAQWKEFKEKKKEGPAQDLTDPLANAVID